MDHGQYGSWASLYYNKFFIAVKFYFRRIRGAFLLPTVALHNILTYFSLDTTRFSYPRMPAQNCMLDYGRIYAAIFVTCST